MSENQPPPDLMDHMMANGFMLEAFMLQVSLEVGRSKPEAERLAWAKSFVSALHERVDFNEAKMPGAMRYPVHELARQGFDRLGEALSTIFGAPPSPKS